MVNLLRINICIPKETNLDSEKCLGYEENVSVNFEDQMNENPSRVAGENFYSDIDQIIKLRVIEQCPVKEVYYDYRFTDGSLKICKKNKGRIKECKIKYINMLYETVFLFFIRKEEGYNGC